MSDVSTGLKVYEKNVPSFPSGAKLRDDSSMNANTESESYYRYWDLPSHPLKKSDSESTTYCTESQKESSLHEHSSNWSGIDGEGEGEKNRKESFEDKPDDLEEIMENIDFEQDTSEFNMEDLSFLDEDQTARNADIEKTLQRAEEVLAASRADIEELRKSNNFKELHQRVEQIKGYQECRMQQSLLSYFAYKVWRRMEKMINNNEFSLRVEESKLKIEDVSKALCFFKTVKLFPPSMSEIHNFKEQNPNEREALLSMAKNQSHNSFCFELYTKTLIDLWSEISEGEEIFNEELEIQSSEEKMNLQK